jgi:hypothetical protein
MYFEYNERKINQLSNVLAIIKGDAISGGQTFTIDEALVSSRVDEIPMGDAQNVIRYIDLQLAHNKVSPEIRDALIRLHSELALRQEGA